MQEKTGPKRIEEEPEAVGKQVQENLGIENGTTVSVLIEDGMLKVSFNKPLTPVQLYAIVRGALGAVAYAIDEAFESANEQPLH